MHLVVDFRCLNSFVEDVTFPMPHISDIMGVYIGCDVFSATDVPCVLHSMHRQGFPSHHRLQLQIQKISILISSSGPQDFTRSLSMCHFYASCSGPSFQSLHR